MVDSITTGEEAAYFSGRKGPRCLEYVIYKSYADNNDESDEDDDVSYNFKPNVIQILYS